MTTCVCGRPRWRRSARVKAPNLSARLSDAIGACGLRRARDSAARLIGEHRIEGALPRLVAAYERGQSDATYVARAAAIEAAGRVHRRAT